MMCNDVDRLNLCKTSLIVSFLDCCREFEFEESEVAKEQTYGNLADVGQHLTLFACSPNDYAYDGNGDHGSDPIAVDDFAD